MTPLRIADGNQRHTFRLDTANRDAFRKLCCNTAETMGDEAAYFNLPLSENRFAPGTPEHDRWRQGWLKRRQMQGELDVAERELDAGEAQTGEPWWLNTAFVVWAIVVVMAMAGCWAALAWTWE